MNSSGLNMTLIEGYFEMLKNLSSENKLKLIEKLSLSIKNSPQPKTGSLKSSYGAFVSEQSADELIQEIKSARTSNRNKEEF